MKRVTRHCAHWTYKKGQTDEGGQHRLRPATTEYMRNVLNDLPKTQLFVYFNVTVQAKMIEIKTKLLEIFHLLFQLSLSYRQGFYFARLVQFVLYRDP